MKKYLNQDYYKEIVWYIVMGLAVHGYLFMNHFHNWDNVNKTYTNNLEIIENGRWFSPIVTLVSGAYVSPWLFGLLCMLMLASAIFMINLLFRMENRTYRMINAALFMSFPVFAATFSYLFNAFCYMTGIFLAVLAVVLLRELQGWKSLIFATLAILCSLGLYQAYICFTIALYFFLMVFDVLEGKKWNGIGIFTLKAFIAGLAAGILDLVVMKSVSHFSGIPLRDNNGFEELGVSAFSQAGISIINSYKRVVDFFFANGVIYNTFPEKIINGIMFLLIALSGGLLFMQQKKRLDWKRILLICVSVIVFPMGINIMMILTPTSGLHYLTCAAYILVYMLPLFIVSKIEWGGVKNGGKIRLLIFAFVGLMCIQNIKTVNGYYLALQLRQERTYALAVRIFDRIEQTADLERNTKIVFIGSATQKEIEKYRETFDRLTDGATGIYNHYFLDTQADWADYAADSLGIEYCAVTDDFAEELSHKTEIQLMPVFPEADSIKQMDDMVIVKVHAEEERK